MNISVIITSYNQKRYLSEAIESVLAQTTAPYEIIISDDVSTDGSQALIEGYAGRYPDLVRPLYHRQNQGPSGNRNAALKEARGEAVTILDGDDRFLPEKLEKEAAALHRHPEARAVYSNFAYISSDGERLRLWAGGEMLPQGNVFAEMFGLRFPRAVPFRAPLVLRQCYEETGYYDPALRLWEDWDMAIRLTQRYAVAACLAVLSEYRQHPSGLSDANLPAHLHALIRVYEKNRPLLASLPAAEQEAIRRRLRAKFTRLARMASGEALGAGRRAEAVRLWWQFRRHVALDRRTAAQLLLPAWAYGRLLAARQNLGRAPQAGPQ